jgi:hypothetical protein
MILFIQGLILVEMNGNWHMEPWIFKFYVIEFASHEFASHL